MDNPVNDLIMSKTSRPKQKNVAVLGGGLCGLAAGAHLASRGFQVTLFERNDHLGGVAANFKLDDGRIIPRSYHHILKTDIATINILKSLGLFEKVTWKKINIKLSVEGQLLDFSDPLDLLAYRGLPLLSKLKMSLMISRILLRDHWEDLEGKSVEDLLLEWGDARVYHKLIHPLIDMKFGIDPSRISAPWLAIRLHAGEPITSYGYIPDTSWTEEVITALSRVILENDGRIFLEKGVRRIVIENNKVAHISTGEEDYEFDHYVSTLPPGDFMSILENAPANSPLVDTVAKVQYVSSYNMIAASSSEPFEDYWTIAHTPRKHFGACFTLNKLNPDLATEKDKSVMNFFTYVPYNDFRLSDEDYAETCRSDLSKMVGKKIDFTWTKVFKFASTVPIFYKDYVNPETRIFSNLYLAGIYKTCPFLSSSGTAMESGIQAANAIGEDND
ncbi:MAG: FAD-dependent oxidoreductase [Candidatus Tantalella remota]|nr:FAD-dependent oxidoreductase [Candidatus Tantalella remota]